MKKIKIISQSIEKDKSIINLLKKLEIKIGDNKFILNDNWKGDLCSIGISDLNENKLIYISTFGKEEGIYHVELENINIDKSGKFKTVEKHQNVNFEKLEKLLKNHLEV